jgi:hypothetical protein
MNDDNSVIIRPESGDTVTAEEVLTEVCGVLKKRGYALIHRSDAMLLVKITYEVRMQGRAIAYVRKLTPGYMEHRPIDWASANVAPEGMGKKAVS